MSQHQLLQQLLSREDSLKNLNELRESLEREKEIETEKTDYDEVLKSGILLLCRLLPQTTERANTDTYTDTDTDTNNWHLRTVVVNGNNMLLICNDDADEEDKQLKRELVSLQGSVFRRVMPHEIEDRRFGFEIVLSSQKDRDATFDGQKLMFVAESEAQALDWMTALDDARRKQLITSSKRSLLMDAIAYGHSSAVLNILIEYGALKKIQSGICDGLVEAIKYDRLSVVEQLLANGLHPNDGRINGLITAAEGGKLDIVRCLLNGGAFIEALSPYGSTALIRATFRKQFKVVELLLERGANLEAKDSRGWTSLSSACFVGELELVELLVRSGANVETIDMEGRTPLFIATERKQTEVLWFLLENNANVNVVAQNGSTPLLYAAQHGLVEIIKILLKNGANIDFQHKYFGSTALIEASINNQVDTAFCLLQMGASVDTVDRGELSALMWACSKGYSEIVELLLNANAHTALAEAHSGKTALMKAVANGHLEVVDYLLVHNVSVEFVDKNGRNALLTAVIYGEFGVAAKLISYGADLRVSDETGSTCLHWASRKNKVELIRLLIEKGVDKEALDEDGWTALMRACSCGFVDCVERLIRHGCRTCDKMKDGFSPLTIAIEYGHLSVVQILLNLGEIDCDEVTQACCRLLIETYCHENVLCFRPSVVQILKLCLSKCPLSPLWSCNAQPLHQWAVDGNYQDIIEVLDT